VRDGTLAHASFANYMRPVRREVERRLEAGQSCGVPKTEGVCREILKRRQALWMFVRHDGVEPTNNAAEVRSVDQKPSLTLGGLGLR
jgi:transposase